MAVTTTTLETRDPAVQGRYPSGAADHSAQIGAALEELRRELELRGYGWTGFSGVAPDGTYDGSNPELGPLHELKALELIHRSLAEAADDRWERAAHHYAGLFHDRVTAAGFTTYTGDAGSGTSGRLSL